VFQRSSKSVSPYALSFRGPFYLLLIHLLSVGVVQPQILQPVLPDLIRSLLLAMSGLEPAALNYLQLRTSDQDSLERLRLQMAQTGPIATAVTKCLDLVPFIDKAAQRSVVPQLDSALRMSAGFATRAAVADAVSKLVSICPEAFRFSGAAAQNPSVRLLRSFYFASEREPGEGK
jgi:proteasome component ECM29